MIAKTILYTIITIFIISCTARVSLAEEWCVAGESLSVIGEWPAKAQASSGGAYTFRNEAINGTLAWHWAFWTQMPDKFHLNGCDRLIVWIGHGEAIIHAPYSMYLGRLDEIITRFPRNDVYIILPDSLLETEVGPVTNTYQEGLRVERCVQYQCIDPMLDPSLADPADPIHLSDAGAQHVADRVLEVLILRDLFECHETQSCGAP